MDERVEAMANNKGSRKRGRILIEPLPFDEIPVPLRAYMQAYESNLRAAGLWKFLSDIEIPWPWPADLSEFLETSVSTGYSQIRVQNKVVNFSAEAIAKVTSLPSIEGALVSDAALPIYSKQWEIVFEGGSAAFDDEVQGWQLSRALPLWKDWLLLVQQRLQLGEADGVLEHCVMCAALTAALKGVCYNWAEELYNRSKEELERKRFERPVPLHCAGYLGLICQQAIGVDPKIERRRLSPPFLRKLNLLSSETMEGCSSHSQKTVETQPSPMEYSQSQCEEVCVKCERVLGELEAQRVLSQQYELALHQYEEREINLKKEVSETRQSIARVQEQYQKVESDLRECQSELQSKEKIASEWQVKCQGLYAELVTAGREKAEWEARKITMENEGKEWRELKSRQDKAIVEKSQEIKDLRKQIRTFLFSEAELIEAQQESQNLQRTVEHQSVEIEAYKRRFERLKAGVWAIESVTPPFNSIYRGYELQKDIFFLVYSLVPKQTLSVSEFGRLWEEVVSDGCENLLTELLVRGEVRVTDLFRTFLHIADIGVRVFQYYTQLEITLSQRRHQIERIMSNPPTREVALDFWNQAVNTAMSVCPMSILQSWRTEILRLKGGLGDDTYLQDAMDASSERLAILKRVDLGPGQYHLKFDQLSERVTRLSHTLEQGGRVELNLNNQAIFFEPHPNLVHRALNSTRRPPISPLAHQFLGDYEALFDTDLEQPIPSWKALEWILEDVGLSRQVDTDPRQSHDQVYRRTCGGWSRTPPLSVTNDPRFCNCPRRYKWPNNALIDGLEYNWPIIPGSFVTARDCFESYTRFSLDHRQHHDPVCFRAAVFAAILAALCSEYNFTYNVNLLSKVNREVLFLTKLNYRASRWLRCIEAMCSTYFIIGPHPSLINEFGATRYGVISRALAHQREVENTLIPREETMAPGFVADYGPSSQRPFKPNQAGGHKRRR